MGETATQQAAKSIAANTPFSNPTHNGTHKKREMWGGKVTYTHN